MGETAVFDIREFYINILSFDEEEVNSGILDMSGVIMNMEQRVRQREFKKRSLNSVLMKIGKDTDVGVKV